ncbi:hypothetical protein CKO28_03105 [Rhodovibrio sodomensis]|uniref:DoxX family protein n=1 Tax=Rhodovibrio sodomensis TaxID=1088 RepID=A0ABS1D9G6_9PROT|nr:hypothetical protein [Rhodovibrio sodomensis]MBK1667032.1 hypothetical protein [Rhodovibrio sodomensis]
MAELMAGRWRDKSPILFGLLALAFSEAGLAVCMVLLTDPFGIVLSMTAAAVVPGVLTLVVSVYHASVMTRATDPDVRDVAWFCRDFYAAGVHFALLLSAVSALT